MSDSITLTISIADWRDVSTDHARAKILGRMIRRAKAAALDVAEDHGAAAHDKVSSVTFGGRQLAAWEI